MEGSFGTGVLKVVGALSEAPSNVSVHDLSPLQDRILTGIAEAVHIFIKRVRRCEAEVVPR